MARPRIPLSKARLEGRDKKDPQRYRSRNEPTVADPLGDPPEWLTDTAEGLPRSAWRLFQVEIPWLNASHRMLVGIAALVQGRMMAGQECNVQSMNLLRLCLGQMGATPTSRLVLPVGEERDDLLD